VKDGCCDGGVYRRLKIKKSFSIALLSSFILLFFMTIWGVSTLSMKKKNTLEAFSAIATAYETALFEYQPELGIFWGKSDVALDRFMDSSIEGYQHWWQQEDDF
jgi:hypothetical protein